MRCRRVLLAINVSRGTDGRAVSRRKIDQRYAAPPGMERVCGTHAVLAILDVFAREQSRGAASPFEGPHGRSQLWHPRRRGTVPGMPPPRLFVRNFMYGDRARATSIAGGTGKPDAAVTEPPVSGASGAPWDTSAGDDDAAFMPVAGRPYTNLRKIVRLARRLRIAVVPVERNTLAYLCGERRNQNIVLEVGSYEPKSLVQLPMGTSPAAPKGGDGNVPSGEGSVFLFLDHIIDPMNLGNILRTAHFFGIRNVVLSADCARCLPSVARCSTGALEWLQIGRVAAGVSTAAFLRRTLMHDVEGRRNANWMVVGATANRHSSASSTVPPERASSSSSPLHRRPSPTNLVLLLGNEDAGLPDDVLQLCTHSVHIPSRGDGCDGGSSARGVSLNVNSACAILLAHVAGVAPLTMRK